MARGGAAWRGWFPLRGELTSGRPDNKEGLYLGEELPRGRPARARRLAAARRQSLARGAPGLQPAVAALLRRPRRAAAEALMAGRVARRSASTTEYFAAPYLQRPTRLFRIFQLSADAAARPGASASTPTTAC